MSRLFEALQRSEPEGFRFDFVQPEPAANEPLKTPELTPPETRGTGTHDFGQFPSVPISVPPDSRLVSLSEKESLGAEKFRFLAVRLRQIQQARHLKKVLITSTIPEEGKSTVSAKSCDHAGAKKAAKSSCFWTAICDARSWRENSAWLISPGLSECLQGESGPMTNIYRLDGAGLWFLPAGKPPENPLELMQSGRLAELLDQLTARFDWIIIDSPPILPLADTSVWTRHCGRRSPGGSGRNDPEAATKAGPGGAESVEVVGSGVEQLHQCRPQQLLSAVWSDCATRKVTPKPSSLPDWHPVALPPSPSFPCVHVVTFIVLLEINEIGTRRRAVNLRCTNVMDPEPLRKQPSPGAETVVLNAETFHRFIALERKRTERSGKPFLLMLLDTAIVCLALRMESCSTKFCAYSQFQSARLM